VFIPMNSQRSKTNARNVHDRYFAPWNAASSMDVDGIHNDNIAQTSSLRINKEEMMSRRIVSRSAITEPESEVHSGGERKDGLRDELGERKEEIASLREVVRQQGIAIGELRQIQVGTTAGVLEGAAIPTSSAGDSKSYDISFELDATHMWSDDDDDDDSSDSLPTGINAAIAAIREEASKVDTVMALNQLDTMQQELNSVTRAMNNRTAEMEELRALLQLKDDRLSTLELERDLYKADAHKMNTDLQNCIEKIHRFDLSAVNISPLEPPSISEVPPIITSTGSTGSRPLLLIPKEDGETSFSEHSRTRSNPNEYSRGRFMSPRTVRPSDVDSVLSDRSTYTVHALQSSRRNRSNGSLPQQKTKTFLPFRNKSGGRHRLQPVVRSSVQMTGISLQKQVDEMNERLVASLKASEELRKRLAMVSRYYETLVRRLQESIVEMKFNQERMETDLVHQISSMDHSRKKDIEAFEAELREKGQEIEQLKARIL